MTRENFLQQLLAIYQIIHTLADKNDCRVLHLRHRQLQKDVVLRCYALPVEAYETLCSVQCDNLPLIYDVIELEDGQAVLEEYIDGMTLTQVMECERYRYRGVKRVLTALCNALTVLHGHGIVHRDVKPENVMVGPDGRVVLIDLNASRQVSNARKDTVIMGTVGYASPEQLGISQSDARTDIYAVGVLLNVMVTGKHPSEELATGRVGRIVRRCTSINPKDRYHSAAKLAEEL